MVIADSLPPEIEADLVNQVADLGCRQLYDPDDPGTWFSANISRAACCALKGAMKSIVERALSRIPLSRHIDGFGAARIVDDCFCKYFSDLLAVMRLPSKFRNWELDLIEYRKAMWEEKVRLKAAIKERQQVLASLMKFEAYPPIPEPMFEESELRRLPACSGVYFIWGDQRVVYVGQSLNIRVRFLNHERMRGNYMVSWLPFEKGMLVFAESFYIGICQPPKNIKTPCVRC